MNLSSLQLQGKIFVKHWLAGTLSTLIFRLPQLSRCSCLYLNSPLTCQERVCFSFWCSVVGSGGNGEPGLPFFLHTRGIQCSFWQLGRITSPVSGARCWLRNVPTWWNKCVRLCSWGFPICVPRGLPDERAGPLGALLVLRSDGGCALAYRAS